MGDAVLFNTIDNALFNAIAEAAERLPSDRDACARSVMLKALPEDLRIRIVEAAHSALHADPTSLLRAGFVAPDRSKLN